ncbi:MAG: endo-1,4-beta-xylanase [Patescibacteria group bacterium]
MKKITILILNLAVLFLLVNFSFAANYKTNKLSKFGFLSQGVGITPQGASELGTPWLRPHPGKAVWGKIEKKQGKFSWKKLDKIVKAAQKKNLNLLITVWPYAMWDQNQCHKNLKDAKGFEKELPKRRGAPCDYEAYKNFLTKLVERYDKDKKSDMKGLKYGVKYWEILNEPEMNQKNSPDLVFFQGTAKDYLKILKESYKTIKKADKKSKILHAGMAGSGDFMVSFWKKIFKKSKGKYFDIGNIHSIDSGVADLNASSYKGLLQKYDIQKSFWITEVQITSQEESFGLQAKAKSEEEQAAEIIKSYIQAYKAEAEKIFYTIYQTNQYVPENLRYAALIEDGRKKPGYYAMQTMVSKIDYFSKVENLAEGQYKFTISDRTVYVLWSDQEIAPEIPQELQNKVVTITDMGGNVSTKYGQEINLTANPVFVE